MANWEPDSPLGMALRGVRPVHSEVSPREREDEAVRDRREFDSDDYPAPEDGKEQDAE